VYWDNFWEEPTHVLLELRVVHMHGHRHGTPCRAACIQFFHCLRCVQEVPECQKAWYGQSNLAAVQHNDAAALLKARSTTITFPVAAAATTVTVT
jgi:hypothetical protein